MAWYDALTDTIRQLGANPQTYPEISEAKKRWNRDIREAHFKTRRGSRYRVIFQIADAELIVLRIRGPGQPPLRRRDLPPKP